MAITLPDIVQRVVLDTRRFTPQNKALGAGLGASKKAAGEAAEAHKGHAKATDDSGKATERQASRLNRLNANLKKVTPNVLGFANNFFKARSGMDGANRSAGRLSGGLNRLTGWLKKGLLAAAKFTAKWGLITAAVLSAIPAVAGLGGGLVALIGSMSRTLAILPALSAGFLGLFAAVGVGLLAFGGVGAAMKSANQAGKKSADTAKSVAAAQRRVFDATRAVADARRDEAKAHQEVPKAAYEAARRTQDALAAVVRAENVLIQSKGRVKAAQDALNKSYEEAYQALIDIRQESERANISEARAGIALRDAQQRLAEIQAYGGTGDELLAAQLDLQSAELDLADAKEATIEATKAAADAEKKGVNQSDLVTAARQELAEANAEAAESAYDLGQAELDLNDARREGEESIIEARERAAEATQRVADAVRDLADAEADVKEARSGGSGGSDEKPANAPTRALVAALQEAKKEIEPLREEVQAVAFPRLISSLKIGMRLLGRFRGNIVDTGSLIGEAAEAMAYTFTGVQDEVDRTWQRSNGLGRGLVKLFASATGAAFRFVDAGGFIIDYFGDLSRSAADSLTALTTGEEARDRMARFQLKALEAAIKWGHIIRDLFMGLWSIFKASGDAGSGLTTSLEDSMAKFREWTESVRGQNALKDFFEDARRITTSLFNIMGRIIKALGGGFDAEPMEAVATFLERIEDSKAFEDLLSNIRELTRSVPGAFLDRITGLWEVFTGKKDAGDEWESIAGSFGKMGSLTDKIGTFADILDRLVDILIRINENPVGSWFLKLIAGLAAVKVIANATGITSLASSAVGVAQTAAQINERRVAGPRQQIHRTDQLLMAQGITPTRAPGPVGRLLGRNPKPIRGMTPPAPVPLPAVTPPPAPAPLPPWAARPTAPPVIGPPPPRTTPGGSSGAPQQQGRRRIGFGGRGGAGGAGERGGVTAGGAAMGLGFGIAAAGTLVGGEVGEKMEKYGTMVGVAALAVQGLSAAQAVLNAVMAANPIGLIVIAIVALAAGLVLLYKKNEGFRKFIDGIWQSIQKMWDVVLPVLKSVWDWVYGRLVVGFGIWKTVATAYFNAIAAVALWFWNSVLKPVISAIWWYITEVLIPVWSRIFDVASTVFNAIAAAATWFWDTILKPVFSAVWWYITKVLIPVWTLILATARDVFNIVAEKATWFWNTILKPVLSAIWWYISNVVVPIFTKIKDTAVDVFSRVRSAVSSAWDFIRPILQKVIDFIQDKVIPKFNTLAEGVTNAFAIVGSVIQAGIDGAKSAINSGLRAIGGTVKTVFEIMGDIAEKVGLDSLGEALHTAANSAGRWGRDSGGGRGGWQDASTGSPGRMASGGQVPFGNAKRVEVGSGFKTGTPRAIVGEGSRHPEYVIPTDPKYRNRAWDLLSSAARDISTGRRHQDGVDPAAGGRRGIPTYGIGGIIGGIKDTFTDAAGNVMDWASAPFDALYAKVKELGAKVLEEVWPNLETDNNLTSMPAAMINKMRQAVIDWLTDETVRKGDSELGGSIYAPYGGVVDKITGLHPVFKERFDRYSNAVGGLSITSGWRSMASQAALYAAYLAGVPGQAPAAPPGRSNHEYGLAIDHAPHSTAAMRDTASTFKLRYPMSYEDWHVEPNEAKAWRDAGLASTQGYGEIIGGNGGSPGANQALGRSMSFAKGWRGPHWDALNKLWQRESNWDHNAVNRSSGAWGIPQSLPGSKMATHGSDWRTNPRTQIAWGLDYIGGRYGDPSNAWAKWQQRSPHWYQGGGRIPELAAGGIITGETWARMGEYGHNEAVVPLDSARGRTMLGGGITIAEGAVQVTVQGNVVEDVMPEVERKIAEALAELTRLISAELEA